MTSIFGMVERCYNSGLYVFRGFAEPQKVINWSIPCESYQRHENDQHTKEIEEFLRSGEYVFAPELILAYDTKDLFDTSINPGLLPAGFAQDESILQTAIDPFRFLMGFQKLSKGYQLKAENGAAFIPTGPKGAHLVRLKIQDKATNIFHRLDGNHRLQAMEGMEKQSLNHKVPICILFLNANGEMNPQKIEMQIFHYINAKALPLTRIDQYKGFLNLFPPDELRQYGEDFFIVAEYFSKYQYSEFLHLAPLCADADEEAAKDKWSDLILFIASYFVERKRALDARQLEAILKVLDQHYADHPSLKRSVTPYSIVPFAVYCYDAGIQKSAKLDAFTDWFIHNKLYLIVDCDPASIICTFEKIYERRKKTIFVAMPFDKKLQFVFDKIYEAVEKLNEGYLEEDQIPTPVRIDKRIAGHSYDIVDEIEKQIENAGYIIADLTGQNANVYYEAGLAQGLIRAKTGGEPQILYLISDPNNETNPYDSAKFDVRNYKMIGYSRSDSGPDELRDALVEELRAFYAGNR